MLFNQGDSLVEHYGHQAQNHEGGYDHGHGKEVGEQSDTIGYRILF